MIHNLKNIILDNVIIEIENIHIRIEDNFVSSKTTSFAFGLHLKTGEFKPTDL